MLAGIAKIECVVDDELASYSSSGETLGDVEVGVKAFCKG